MQREKRDCCKSPHHHWQICWKRLAISCGCYSGRTSLASYFFVSFFFFYIKLMVVSNKKELKKEITVEQTYQQWKCSSLFISCTFFKHIHQLYIIILHRKFLKWQRRVLEGLGHFVGYCPCLILQDMTALTPSVEHLTLEFALKWLQVTALLRFYRVCIFRHHNQSWSMEEMPFSVLNAILK